MTLGGIGVDGSVIYYNSVLKEDLGTDKMEICVNDYTTPYYTTLFFRKIVLVCAVFLWK